MQTFQPAFRDPNCIVYMTIHGHGSDCHKPLPQSLLPRASLYLRENGERNAMKFEGDLPIVNHAILIEMWWSL